jgi:hypothetical protein
MGNASIQYNPSSSILKYFLDYGLCDNSSICPITQQTKILDAIYEVFKGGLAT